MSPGRIIAWLMVAWVAGLGVYCGIIAWNTRHRYPRRENLQMVQIIALCALLVGLFGYLALGGTML